MTDTGNRGDRVIDYEVNVRFTKITSTKSNMCKVMSLNSEGEIVAEPPLTPGTGYLETIELNNWKEQFGPFLDNLTLNEGPIIGTINKTNGNGNSISRIKFVTKAKYASLPKSSKENTISRSKDFLQFHTPDFHSEDQDVCGNLVMLDIDDMSSFEIDGILRPNAAGTTIENIDDAIDVVMSKLLSDLPELRKITSGFWAMPSAGACIMSDTGEILKGLSGLHIYFILPLTNSVNDLKQYITHTLWNCGGGYIKVNEAGGKEARTYIDSAVFSPERIDFIAGSKCKSGLQQVRGNAIFYPNVWGERRELNTGLNLTFANAWEVIQRAKLTREVIELSEEKKRKSKKRYKKIASTLDRVVTKDLTPEACSNYKLEDRELDAFLELSEVRERNQKVIEAKRAYYEATKNGTEFELDPEVMSKSEVYGILPGNYPIQLDGGTFVTVWQILLEPQEYDKQTILDPLTPKEENKAIIYARRLDDGVSGYGISGGGGGNGIKYEVSIYTHKRGGEQYYLTHNYKGLREMIANTDETVLENKLGTNWLEIITGKGGGVGGKSANATNLDGSKLISNSDRQALLNLLKGGRGSNANYTKEEIKLKFKAAVENINSDSKEYVFSKWNEKYACINLEGKFRVMEEKKNPSEESAHYIFMSKADFLAEVKNSKIYEWKDTGECAPIKNPGEVWMDWEGRKEYQGITFSPNLQQQEVNGWLNMFKGFAVSELRITDRPCKGKFCEGAGCIKWFANIGRKECGIGSQMNSSTWGCGAKKDAVIWWLRHLHDNVCGGDFTTYTWVLDWISDLIQNPGGDLKGTAIALLGGQGCGKGMIANTVMALLGTHAYAAHSMEQITGRFNAHLANKLFVYCDESVWGGDRSKEGALKTLISEPYRALEYKGVDGIMLKNHVRVMASSNRSWAVPTDADERRWCVLNCYDGYAPSNGADKSRKWFSKIGEIKGSLGELLHELMENEIKSDLRTILNTEALREQKLMNLEIEHLILMELTERLINSTETIKECFRNDVKNGLVRGNKASSGYRNYIKGLTDKAYVIIGKDFGVPKDYETDTGDVCKEYVRVELKSSDNTDGIESNFNIKISKLEELAERNWFRSNPQIKYLRKGQLSKFYKKVNGSCQANIYASARFSGNKARSFAIRDLILLDRKLNFMT